MVAEGAAAGSRLGPEPLDLPWAANTGPSEYAAALLLPHDISYRKLEETLRERGAEVDDTMLYRWTQRYEPKLEKYDLVHKPIVVPGSRLSYV